MPFVKRVVYLSIWIWAIVLLSGPGTLFAQFDKLDESWRWVHFTTETGLPSNRVFAIQETPSGTVWVATQAGLAWFDGYYWHPAQGLPQDRAAIIVPSADDRVIVLMSGRVFQGGEGGFQLIPLTRDGKPVKVSSLSYLSDGKNLVVVDSTIYLLKEEVLEPYPVSSILSGRKVLDIKTTGDGGLWINTTDGLYRRSRTVWSLVLPAPQLPLGIEWLVAGVDGRALARIWSPQEMKGVWEIDPQEVPRRLVEEGPDFVQAIDVAPNGNAIMALETGRVRLRQQYSWQSLPTHAPQMESSLAFRFRKNGDLWVGTERGVFLFLASSTRWAHWGHRDLDDRSSINEIIQRRDSSIWIARGRGLEIHDKDGTMREIEQINGVDLHPVTGLAEDREGNVWISSGGGFDGTYRWDGKKWEHFGRKDGLAARLIHKIVVDRQGRPWFLGLSGYDPQTSDGINGPGAFVYTDGSFVRWGEKEGLQNGRVYAFAEGVQGELWFGTGKGISCRRDGQWTYWGHAEGLKSELVFTLAVDQENRLWFGDREFGVGLIEHVVPRYFTTADGLISDAVWHVTVGADGRLWVATRGGLSSFFRGAWMSLGPSAGLNHANLWPLLPLKDELYVGTTGGGTAILRPGEIGERNPVIVPAPAVVENASALLRWDTFSYLGERAHNEIETRYRLDENQWSPWSLEREVTLSDCSPGDHRFVVQAKGLWGTRDSLGQSISFSVPYPFYMRPIYYLPTLGLIFGIVTLTVVYVSRKRRFDEALAWSEAQHRSVVRDQSEFIMRFLPDGTRTFVNPAYCHEFGKSSTEYIGTNFFEFLDKENSERIRRKLAGLTPKNPVATDEHCSVAPSGEICWHQWTDRAIFDNRGLVVEFQAVGQDITERRRMEEALRESQNRLSLFFNQSLDGFYFSMLDEPKAWNEHIDKEEVLDYVFSHQRITEVNDAMLAQYGAPRENFIGRPLSAFFKHDSEQGRRLRRRLFDDGHLHVETSELKEDGTPIWIEGDYVCMYDGQHRITGTFGIQRDVTERKQAVSALKESEKQNRAIVNAVPDLLFRVNSDGTILDYRAPSASELYVPPEMFLGKNVNNVLPPHVAQPAMEAIGRALHSKEMVTFEYELALHGEQRYYEDRIVPLSANEALSVIRDTTERRKAEELLSASEQSYRGLFNTVNDAIYLLDSEGKFIDVNHGAVEMYGYPREYFVGKTPEFISAPGRNNMATTQEAIRKAFAGTPQQFEWWGLRKNGNIFPKDVRLKKGTYFGKDVIIALGLDITDRKQAEETLRQSEERYRSLVDSMHDGVLQVDNDDIILFVNHITCSMLGYASEELLGRSAHDTFILQADRNIINEKNRLRIEGLADRYEVRAVKKSGEIIWLTVSGAPRYDEKGMAIGSVAILSDITERKQSQERYRRIVEGTHAILFSTTTQGFFTYANEAACRMLELPLDQLVGRLFARWVHPDDRRRVMATYREQARVGIQSVATEFRYLSAGGKEGWLSFLSNPVFRGEEVVEIFGIAQDITERKRAEGALAERENRYRALFDLSPSGILLEDQSGTILEANEALCKSFHYSREDLIGENVSVLVPPEHRPHIEQHIAQILAGKTLEHEVDNIARDGTVHRMELRETSIPLGGGRTGILSVANDITERKRIEAILHETNQTLEAFVNASPLAIVIVDLAGLIRLWNPAAETFFGWKSEEVQGKPNPLVPPEKLDEHLGLRTRIIAGGETILGLEVIRRKKDGSLIQVSLSTAALHGNDGTMTGVMAIFEDITKRKRAEESLASERNLLRTLIDNLPDRIYVKDIQSRFLLNNVAHMQSLGVTSMEEIVGKSDYDYRPRELATQYCADDNAVFESGQPLFNREEAAAAESGEKKWLLTTKVPLKDQRGNVTGLVGISRDITERRNAEEQMRASLREKEVLLKEIHHRVKNNLQVISSLLSLQSSYVKDKHSLELFKESQNRVKSMALIHEKLYQSEDLANIDFTLYVKNLTAFLFRSYVIDPSIVTMVADVQDIQLNIERAIPCGLIINELVSNSLKHAFPRGNAGRVFVGLTASDDSILKLVVGDNGIGLPEHINLRSTESLGLQLVASLADQLGATVEVKRVGGTEYGISFPK